jgi:hypothetical protein
MDFLPAISAELGNVKVTIVNNRTMTAEEWADQAVDKIIYVAETASPEIKASANAFKQKIWGIIAQYIKKAVDEERAWVKAHPKED